MPIEAGDAFHVMAAATEAIPFLRGARYSARISVAGGSYLNHGSAGNHKLDWRPQG